MFWEMTSGNVLGFHALALQWIEAFASVHMSFTEFHTLSTCCETSSRLLLSTRVAQKSDHRVRSQRQVALITGVTGQDGSYLAELLFDKGYEVYNLGAQSHVGSRLRPPSTNTTDMDGLGVLLVLSAIRSAGLEKQTKVYQASTSELFGKVREVPQSETTPFFPRSTYGVAKLYLH